MEKYAVDIRFLSWKYLACQDAYYSHVFPSNNSPHVRPPKRENCFAKFKPDPQLLPVPGMTMLDSLKDLSNSNPLFVIPISHGFVCELGGLKPLVAKLQKLTETLSVLSATGKQLEELKRSSLVVIFIIIYSSDVCLFVVKRLRILPSKRRVCG
jgi:hypothetical protein